MDYHRLFFTLLFYLGMKILHVTTSTQGGAGIAAKRHCEAMRKAGINASLIALFGNGDFTITTKYQKTALKKKSRDKILHKLSRLVVKRVAWHWIIADYDITYLSEVQNADIIYIHWVNDFLGYKAIKELLSLGKPVIWYMHDMWPITGGCHYSFDCKGYESLCRHCPQMKFARFLASGQLQKKIKEWRHYSNFYLAAPSQWLCDCIRNSSLFKGHKVFCCPNVIDTSIFCPSDKLTARKNLGLPTDKRFILFSAMGIKNPYKGAEYLLEAISHLNNDNYEFMVIGKADKQDFPPQLANKLHIIGFVSETAKLVNLYNAADVLIITSIAENFPNVVIEAMSCGIPAVGFSTGGIKDQIHHKENGYLVTPRDVNGIIKGIDWVLEKADYNELSIKARQYVENYCSYNAVLKNHQQILNLQQL